MPRIYKRKTSWKFSANPANWNRMQQVRTAKRKIHVLRHYAQSDIPRCKRCGICDVRFLTLDHIDNDGWKDRKEKGTGNGYYKWLVDHDFCDNLQVLCISCNHIKTRGRDPKREKRLREQTGRSADQLITQEELVRITGAWAKVKKKNE